jgi:hypothetical protein
MKRVLLGAMLVLFLVGAPAATQNQSPLRILFIGNSYTQANDLPKMIAELAKAGGQRPLSHARETPGGWTFKKHFEGGKAVPKMASEKWDIVVLQDNSYGPIKLKEEMYEYGPKLDAEIKKHKARTIFYMTWARQNISTMQAPLAKAYQELAHKLNAEVAPVGLAWQAALKTDPAPMLHVADKSHPSKTGTYLTACVFYATIYGKSPVGLLGKIAGLDDKAARALQDIAWKTVQASKANDGASK